LEPSLLTLEPFQVEFEALIVDHQAALDRLAKEKAKLDAIDDKVSPARTRVCAC